MAEPTKKRKRQRGIFAIEGEWFSDLGNGVSFRPLLEVMQCLKPLAVRPSRCCYRRRAFYYLKKWSQKRYARYPILYLGFHGEEEAILIGDGRESKCRVYLDDLMNVLDGQCEKRVIYIGSCSTMGIDERRLSNIFTANWRISSMRLSLSRSDDSICSI